MVAAPGSARSSASLAMLPRTPTRNRGNCRRFVPNGRRTWRVICVCLGPVPVRQAGSPVRVEVWDALRRIPPGEPISYGEMADVIGRPRAARAVGSACGANHVAPFVPCHRVIAADGGLGGYGYGLPIKQWLLDHESRRQLPPVREPDRGVPARGSLTDHAARADRTRGAQVAGLIGKRCSVPRACDRCDEP